MKQKTHLRIEDFSVCIDEIPISKDRYEDNQLILSSLLIPYLEEEVQLEFEKANYTVEENFYLSQVVSINYGVGSFNLMKYVVAILEDIKKI